MRLLLKGLVGMALAWLVIGFGMELFFLADRVHPALRVIAERSPHNFPKT